MYDLRPLVKGPSASFPMSGLFGGPLPDTLLSCIWGSLRVCLSLSQQRLLQMLCSLPGARAWLWS